MLAGMELIHARLHSVHNLTSAQASPTSFTESTATHVLDILGMLPLSYVVLWPLCLCSFVFLLGSVLTAAAAGA